jgi:hypothetical protein
MVLLTAKESISIEMDINIKNILSMKVVLSKENGKEAV